MLVNTNVSFYYGLAAGMKNRAKSVPNLLLAAALSPLQKFKKKLSAKFFSPKLHFLLLQFFSMTKELVQKLKNAFFQNWPKTDFALRFTHIFANDLSK